MDNYNEKNVYNDAERARRRRRNRIFNTVLYCVSGALILFGVFIILRDQTDLFNHNTAEVPDFTFPPVKDTDPVVDIYTPAPTEPDSSAPPATPEPTKPPPGVTEAPTPTPTARPTPEPGSVPVSIYFYDHDLAVSVVPVGLNTEGAMETIPKHDVAGWYKFGPAPNEDGNCIIAGHNRYSGQKGLFALLHKGLAVGDKVVVTMENGNNVFYIVESINNYKYNSVPESVMSSGGERRLTLITCLGDFNYDLQMSETRVVAVCRPVD